MTHLTYWYGQFNDLPNAYSFQKTSQLLSYEKGMKKTEKKLNGIRQKQDAGKKIPSKDLNFMKGFEEMEADRSKEPAERFGYIDASFLEEYHMLSEEEDVEINQRQSKKQTKTTKSASESKVRRKKQKVKKGESSTQSKKKTLEVIEEGKTPKPKKKISKKRMKKDDSAGEISRAKKKVKKSGDNDHDSKIREKHTKNYEKENVVDQKDNLKASAKSGDRAVGIFDAEKEEKKLIAYEEFAALGDVSSHGGTDDGSLKIDESESDEDMADEDYIEKPKARVSLKKTTQRKANAEKRTTKLKALPKKKAQKAKIKVETYDISEQMSIDSKKLLKKEQSKFHNCEIQYLPLLRRWEKAINDKSAAQLSIIFDELLESMEHFTAPFIEEYSMSDLMKRSKGYNNEKRKKVLTKFKTIYKGKKNEVPKGFKATKQSEKFIKTETAVNGDEQLDAPNLLKVKQKRKDIVTPIDVSPKTQETPIAKDSLSSRITRDSEFNGEATLHAMLEPSLPRHSKLEVKLEGISQKHTIASSKAEKKKRFSLGNLMRAGSSSSRQVNVGTKVASSVEASPIFLSKSQSNNHESPSWTMKIVSEDYSDENRSFGVEFLHQAALYIPESNTMNYDAVARNIEIAIYNWSTGSVESGTIIQNNCEASWLNRYWNKIHDIAACISGKYKGGTLAKMICDGKFATPDELVYLRDRDLLSSFEGLPLSKLLERRTT